MKKGYKQTEIGVIPEDWEVKPLNEIAPLQRGFDLPYSQMEEGKYPVVFSNGVGAFHNAYMAKGPGVITGRSGTIGKVHYISTNYWPHNTTLWVTDFHGNDEKYVYYLFQTVPWELFNSGSSVPTLNRNDIHDTLHAIPPRPEQQRIAEALSDMDELIASLEKLIAKKKAIKQGAMQELLTGKRRLPGFSGEWREYAVEDIAVFCTASIPTSWINLRQYIGTDNMLANRDGIRDNTIAIPYVVVREYREGDILLSNIRPYLKKIWLADKAGGCSNDVFVIRSINNEKVLPTFLFYLLSQDAFFDEVMASSVGTKMPRGDKNIIKNYRITVPIDSSEQQSIVSILSSMDYETKKLKEKLEKTRQIKQGMMQQLLTGKIRV